MNEHLNIILNGNIVKGNNGESILELCRRNEIEIPTLCNDPRIEPFTSCYICVVEVEGMKGLQPSCSTKIAEGMKINTDNEKVYKARKTALDLLLSNHYADCAGPCKQTCPAGVDVQGYISYIEKGMYHDAVAVIKETNPLPAICGRVCVRPCEVACRRNLLDEGAAVGIDYLKRFAADIDLDSPDKFVPALRPKTGKKVAIIGAGPAGLSAGFFLAKEGHHAEIFEAAPKAGGWLRYGIPEYRLPNDLLQKEVDNITEMGVKIHYEKKLGDNLSYKELRDYYDAIVLGVGSQAGTSIGCEGDTAGNVFSGIDFLKEMELTGKKFDFSGKTVAVIGGGNTAMDCCRTSLRCGAKKVYVIYRRTEKEMPANPIEIHESKLEGVEYMFLSAPVKVNADEKGNVKSVTCLKMGLGEPDASGRRRPMPIEGSEFEVPVDYILAAIGQKTIVEFVDEVNGSTKLGELKLTKWGDIDADSVTLQTGVKNIFAAGDGVTGPATLIQAIAQAKIASRSCHQYLSGLQIEPDKKEFLSKRENFREQKKEDYVGRYARQHRHEMPTLDPAKRLNFQEVELGYENEDVAKKEANRCLECGCVEYFSCDLKRYATEYGADQKKFDGDFIEYNVDFNHPYIEIDNNKCILCSRCIRICREVVGANALGLVNRGFKTYVAPSMGEALKDTDCESCGMCISTCPTGALTENVNFKPGPVKLDSIDSVCNYCGVGCQITVHHKKGYVMKVTGKEGTVNKDGNICRYPRFGYNFYNDPNRITKPLLKKGSLFVEIGFDEAINIISDKIKSAGTEESAFFAGARLSNEEQYMIQKLARFGAKNNNVFSFHYLNRGQGYKNSTCFNVPLNQIEIAKKVYLLGAEINRDNAVAGFMISNLQYKEDVPVELITTDKNSSMKHKADSTFVIKDYYYFAKAVNHYLLANNLENPLFIKDRCEGFDEYKKQVLAEDYKSLVVKAVSDESYIEKFAVEYNDQICAVLVFSEKEVSANATFELFNLAMITGKLGKTCSGLICLKEKNNSQGITDMGIFENSTFGGLNTNNAEIQNAMKEEWKVKDLNQHYTDSAYDDLNSGKFKNILVFGEDPVGCAIDKSQPEKWFKTADFVVVQDYFMTETAMEADLILPASFELTTGGSYTNSQKVIQQSDSHESFDTRLVKNNVQQLSDLLVKFGSPAYADISEVMGEFITLLPLKLNCKHTFQYTKSDSHGKLFNYGCDAVVKYFEEDFSLKMK
jgi:formate dehydrogenase major subunit